MTAFVPSKGLLSYGALFLGSYVVFLWALAPPSTDFLGRFSQDSLGTRSASQQSNLLGNARRDGVTNTASIIAAGQSGDQANVPAAVIAPEDGWRVVEPVAGPAAHAESAAVRIQDLERKARAAMAEQAIMADSTVSRRSAITKLAMRPPTAETLDAYFMVLTADQDPVNKMQALNMLGDMVRRHRDADGRMANLIGLALHDPDPKVAQAARRAYAAAAPQ